LRVAAAAVVLALAAGGGPGAFDDPAGADPLADADSTVHALREEADRAALEYFDALARAATLDSTIQKLEARLPALVKRRQRLRTRAEDRAVTAYKRAGEQLAILIDSDDALTAARRRQLLARLNERDAAVFTELTRTSDRVKKQRRRLRDARTEQERTLTDLDQRGRDIDAKLQAALDRRNGLQAEADAAAAAAAASPTTAAPAAGAPPVEAAPIPTTPPPGYRPTPGTHPHHDDPFLVCTRARESGGNYAAANPAGPYLGAYQFLQSTWNGGANHAGRLELVGVPPNTASEYDQDDVAWAIYQWRGKGPWGDAC
jgi:prefoldin subunit 5